MHTPFLAAFWTHGANFDQIHNVTSYLGQRRCISWSKTILCENLKYCTLQDPKNPKLAPQGSDGALERQNWL